MCGPPRQTTPQIEGECRNVSDEIVENVDNDVIQTVTDEVGLIEEVIVQSRRASLEDIKGLPGMRKAQAVPFVIPGTDLEVLLAPSSQTQRYKGMIVALAAIKQSTDADDKQDDNQRVEIIEAMANSLLKSCVLEPPLDDEAIAALNEYNSTGVTALLEECRKISGMDSTDDTKVVENFIFGSLLGMS